MNKILNKIFNETLTSHNNVDILFQKIIEYESSKQNLNIKLIIKDFDEPFNSYAEDNSIYIKKSIIKKVDFSNKINKDNNIYYLIKNLYHELEHIKQQNKLELNIIEDGSMFYLITNLINEYYDKNYYLNNYNYQEIEIDANFKAWKSVIELLGNKNKIISQIEEEISKVKLNYLLINRSNINKSNISVFDYIPLCLNEIVKKNKHLLNDYPILNYFYDKNGMDKTIIELLENNIILEFHNNCSIFIERLFFHKVLKQDTKELKMYSNEIYLKYIELFEAMIINFYDNFNYLKKYALVDNKQIKLAINYYNNDVKLIIDKLDIIIDEHRLTKNYQKLINIKKKLIETKNLLT